MPHVRQDDIEQRWIDATAAALRAERGVAGISQAEMERRTGIARTSYRLYEMGVRSPDVAQLGKIAEALRISFSLLMSEIERRHEALNATDEDFLGMAAYEASGPTDRERMEAQWGDDPA